MNWYEIAILTGVMYTSMFLTFQAIKNIRNYIHEQLSLPAEQIMVKYKKELEKELTNRVFQDK